MPPRWFDAHLDLAYLAVNHRDMLAPPESCGGPDLPAAVTLPSLSEGRATRCLATIFTEAGGAPSQPHTYPDGDWHAAYAAGRLQLDVYTKWRSAGLAKGLSILIEGADPIADPSDLFEWTSAGVVAIGMAWWKPSRYAGGNGTDLGLSDAGRVLARTMDAVGLIHDTSHLSDRAFWDLAAATDKLLIASHSNCRALMGGGSRGTNQRHLHDDQIREITRRGGVIGLNLFSKFLTPPTPPTLLAPDDNTIRASIVHCLRHIEHICNIAGSRRHVGLGSDMDGGFSALRLPAGIDKPADYVRLARALAERGWNDADINAFAFDNWARIFPA